MVMRRRPEEAIPERFVDKPKEDDRENDRSPEKVAWLRKIARRHLTRRNVEEEHKGHEENLDLRRGPSRAFSGKPHTSAVQEIGKGVKTVSGLEHYADDSVDENLPMRKARGKYRDVEEFPGVKEDDPAYLAAEREEAERVGIEREFEERKNPKPEELSWQDSESKRPDVKHTKGEAITTRINKRGRILYPETETTVIGRESRQSEPAKLASSPVEKGTRGNVIDSKARTVERERKELEDRDQKRRASFVGKDSTGNPIRKVGRDEIRIMND